MRSAASRPAGLLMAWCAVVGLALVPATAAAAGPASPPAAGTAPQSATRAAGGGQDAPGAAATPESVVVPDSAVVTGARLDELTARVAAELRCPVCRNQSVLESSSSLAREMQAEIKRRLARGESPDEVRSYFVSRYGEWILLKPSPRGINLLVYVLPALALLLGGLLVWHLLKKWTRAGTTEDAEHGGGSAEVAHEPRSPADEGVGLTPDEEERLESVLQEGTGRTS